MCRGVDNTQARAVIIVWVIKELSIAGMASFSIRGLIKVGICNATAINGAATNMEPVIPSNTMLIAITLPQRFEITSLSNLVRIPRVPSFLVTAPERIFSIQLNLQSLVYRLPSVKFSVKDLMSVSFEIDDIFSATNLSPSISFAASHSRRASGRSRP